MPVKEDGRHLWRRTTRCRLVDVFTVWERAAGHCQLCGLPVTPETASIDHIIPLCQGGPHERMKSA